MPLWEFSFCFYISYAYICTCIRQHLKETIPSSSITWSEMGEQNLQANKEVYSPWIVLVRKHGCHDVTWKRPIRYSIISLKLSLHFRRSQVCPNCDTKFPTCIVSGRPLMDYQFWMCGTCKHRAYEQEISTLNHCPLCHAPI